MMLAPSNYALLDPITYADGVLPTPPWTTLPILGNNLKVVSNQVAGNHVGSLSEMYWNPASGQKKFGPNAIFWVDVPVLPSSDGDYILIRFGLYDGTTPGTAPDATPNCYAVQFQWKASVADNWIITKATAGVGSTLATAAAANLVAGDAIGLEEILNGDGSLTINFYRWDGTSVTLQATATDAAASSPYTSAGYVSFGVKDSVSLTARLDNLRGQDVSLIPTNVTPPAIQGTPSLDSTVLATGDTWANTPTSFTRQWYRNGVAIGGATGQTYRLTTADIGQSIRVGVVAINAAGSSAEALSAAIGPVLASIPGPTKKFGAFARMVRFMPGSQGMRP